MKRPIEAVIEDVIIEPSKIQPIIVTFQNGELKDEEAKRMSCGMFFDEKKGKRLLAMSNGQIVYRGHKPDTSQDPMRTMLVFHNKKTGKVRLVQAERWQVNPVLEKPVVKENMDSVASKIFMLNNQFGSNKARRKTELYHKLQINVEAVKDQLEQTVSKIDIDRMELSVQTVDDESSLVPICNRNATSVEHVYNVYDIIPKDKLETLFDKAKEMLHDDSSSLEKKSKFFSQTMTYLKSDQQNVEKAAILLYIEGVVAWLNMPMKCARKRGIEVCLHSEEVNLHIIETYSVPCSHGRLRPNSVKDKGVMHCMILSLIVNNFSLDIELFATIFSQRVGLKKLTDLARIIGALKQDKKTVALKVPLPAQLSLTRKGKKK